MSADKLRVAEQLMKEKRYNAARAVLETIDSPQATDWLRDLKTLSPERPRTGGLVVTVITAVVCLIIGFAVGSLTRGAASSSGSPTAPAVNHPDGQVIEVLEAQSFSNEQFGLNPQIGPIRFTSGTYRATAKTDGNLIVTLTVPSGTCGDRIGSGRSLFNVLAGQANNSQEAIFTATGCDATMRVNGAQSAWTITLERFGD